MDTNLVISLVVLLLVVVGFVSGKFRLGLVGMAGAILLNLTGVLTFDCRNVRYVRRPGKD